MKYLLVVILISVKCVCSDPVIIRSEDDNSRTYITAQNVSIAKVDFKLLNKSHHLFIGRCHPKYLLQHQENIILTNDGKSHVSANIRINIEGPVYITCVNIYDEIPNGEGGYPSFKAGGVGHNFVEFDVITNYGKGFHFFVQIYGYTIRDKEEKKKKI